nr:NAD(P)H-binding protein [Janibacter alkaliphilus]
MVGSRVVTESVTRGHDVAAAARTPAPRPSPAVDSRRVDATDPRQVDEALTWADALVLAVRAAPGDLELVAAATEVVLHSAQRLDARVLVVGGAGPLRSPDRPGTLVVDDPRYVPPAWRQVAGVSVRQLEVCQAHPTRHGPTSALLPCWSRGRAPGATAEARPPCSPRRTGSHGSAPKTSRSRWSTSWSSQARTGTSPSRPPRTDRAGRTRARGRGRRTPSSSPQRSPPGASTHPRRRAGRCSSGSEP